MVVECPSPLQSFKCLTPFFKDGHPFPCGNCLYCRIQNSKSWALRMSLEASLYPENEISFITLTYDKEHCPEDYSLRPRDLTLFFKRLRIEAQRQGYTKKLRYYACGEYGDEKGRPHYHIVLFGLPVGKGMPIKNGRFRHNPDPEWQRADSLVRKCWQLGSIIEVDKVDSARGVGSYVAEYVTKKIGNSKKVAEQFSGRIPPFLRCSKGLGLEAAFQKFYDICKQAYDTFGDFSHLVYEGRPLVLPRYLRNKIAEQLGVLDDLKKKGLAKIKEYADETISLFENFNAYPIDIGIPRILYAWQWRHSSVYDARVAYYKLKKERYNGKV